MPPLPVVDTSRSCCPWIGPRVVSGERFKFDLALRGAATARASATAYSCGDGWCTARGDGPTTRALRCGDGARAGPSGRLLDNSPPTVVLAGPRRACFSVFRGRSRRSDAPGSVISSRTLTPWSEAYPHKAYPHTHAPKQTITRTR
jgi:hypothetical protein